MNYELYAFDMVELYGKPIVTVLQDYQNGWHIGTVVSHNPVDAIGVLTYDY